MPSPRREPRGGHPGLEQQRLLLWTAWLICSHHREIWQGGRGTVDRMTVCVEHLNSHVADHLMKGNRGDDLGRVEGLIPQVDSLRLKLLFDIYHAQIMHGEILRRLE